MITFNSAPTLHFEAMPLNQAPSSVDRINGGTQFTGALEIAREVIQRSVARRGRDYHSIMVFMSDGGDGNDPQANTEARQLRCANATHYIAFGQADHNRLQSLATDSGGAFHAAAQGADLIRVFRNIAADADKMTDDMIHRFGQKMADMVVNKLILDHM